MKLLWCCGQYYYSYDNSVINIKKSFIKKCWWLTFSCRFKSQICIERNGLLFWLFFNGIFLVAINFAAVDTTFSLGWLQDRGTERAFGQLIQQFSCLQKTKFASLSATLNSSGWAFVYAVTGNIMLWGDWIIKKIFSLHDNQIIHAV